MLGTAALTIGAWLDAQFGRRGFGSVRKGPGIPDAMLIDFPAVPSAPPVEQEMTQALVTQALGYIAAVLVFCTFYMRTMLPLRWLAISSNVAFLAYSVPLGLWPVAVLHAVLLPLNLFRLQQLRRMLQSVRVARCQEFDPMKLMSAFTLERRRRGTLLFHKGQSGDAAYYLVKGMVEIPEFSVRIGPGEFFGEMGVFSDARSRTGSAFCMSDVELYRIDDERLVLAFYQDPALALALVRLITKRLSANLERVQAIGAL